MNPSARPFLGIVAVIGIVLLIVHGFGRVTRAAPPAGADPNSPTAQWFKSLKRVDRDGNEYSCCDLSDCRFVTVRLGPQGYEVLIDRETFGIEDKVAWLAKFGSLDPQWVPVPHDKVLQGKENPYGRAAVCWTPISDVICFVRALEI